MIQQNVPSLLQSGEFCVCTLGQDLAALEQRAAKKAAAAAETQSNTSSRVTWLRAPVHAADANRQQPNQAF